MDTRLMYGGIVQVSIFRAFTIKTVCGIPPTAKAASLNSTVVGPSNDGFVSLSPYNTPFPGVSSINLVAGEPAIANDEIVPLTAGTPDLAAAMAPPTGREPHTFSWT